MVLAPKQKRTELSEVQRCRIWTLHEEGYNPTQISLKTGHPRSTVSSFLIRHTKSGSTTFKSNPRSGRPKKITPRGERALLRTALFDTRMTLKALATPSKSGQQLNHHTVSKVLKRHGKAKRRPRKKPYLKPEHKKKRRAHSKHELAIKRDPRKVCWSDECTFVIGEDGTTIYVTRGPGRDEEYADKNLKPTFKSGRTKVSVWSCFCGDEMGPLYIYPDGDTMTATRYHWVMKTKFVPFYERMRAKYGDEVVMMQDGASYHTAKMIKAYITKKGLRFMNHPAQSPDFNPIEHVWKYIK